VVGEPVDMAVLKTMSSGTDVGYDVGGGGRVGCSQLIASDHTI
jgi:hypothetical protein